VTRACARQALLLGLLALAAPPVLRAQGPAAERVLIELQMGRIAGRTVEAFRAGDNALIPLGVFFELSEIRSAIQPDGTLEAMIQPGNVRFVVDPATRSMRVGGTKTDLTADELTQTATDVYLDTRIIGKAFSLEWDVSWPDLQVTVVDPSSLPVALRIRRDAMVQAQLASSAPPLYVGQNLGLQRSRFDGVVFDYSLVTPTNNLAGAAYSGVLGLDVLGGSLALGVESQDGVGSAPRTLASWTGVWLQNPWLTQLRLGDAFATGPRGRSVRGFSMTNSPYLRPSVLGTVPFDGQLGAGWTVEAYRGGRLIGFDSVNALGRFSFDVPVQYGENPVDFIAYGPFGEMRTFNQAYRVLPTSVPAGRFEYGLSFGACRSSVCGASGNLDLRYGLSDRWTIRAGADHFSRDSLGALNHPYAGIIGAIGNSLQIEAEAVVNATLRAAVLYQPSINFQLQVEGNNFARGVIAPILTPQGRLNQVTVSGFFRPIPSLGSNYIEASFDRIHATASDQLSGRLGVSFQLGNVRALPSVRMQQETVTGGPRMTQSFLGLTAIMLPQPALGPLLGRFTARAAFEYQAGAGASSASGFVGLPITSWLRMETGASWFRGSSVAFSLLVGLELPGVRSYTTVTAGASRPVEGSQYVSGSAIYNPARGGVDFSATPAILRGGVAGTVFLDANSNGTFDAGESPLAGVRVVAGPIFAFSDSSGQYHVWDVMAYEPTMVAIDSSTLASPLWVPAFAATMVELPPNRYRSLDIPVLPGGTVEGHVLQPSGALASGGIVVVFTHRESGERRLLTTFGDGSFYAIGMRPGEWEAAVDPKCLDRLNLTAQPARFTMKADVDGAAVEGLDIRLR
jgi:hypothetical protein